MKILFLLLMAINPLAQAGSISLERLNTLSKQSARWQKDCNRWESKIARLENESFRNFSLHDPEKMLFSNKVAAEKWLAFLQTSPQANPYTKEILELYEQMKPISAKDMERIGPYVQNSNSYCGRISLMNGLRIWLQSKEKLGLSAEHTKTLIQLAIDYGRIETAQGISFMARAAQVNILQGLAKYHYLEGKRNYTLELNELEQEILRQRDEIVKKLPKSPKQKVSATVMEKEIEMGKPLQAKLASFWNKVSIN